SVDKILGKARLPPRRRVTRERAAGRLRRGAIRHPGGARARNRRPPGPCRLGLELVELLGLGFRAGPADLHTEEVEQGVLPLRGTGPLLLEQSFNLERHRTTIPSKTRAKCGPAGLRAMHAKPGSPVRQLDLASR